MNISYKFLCQGSRFGVVGAISTIISYIGFVIFSARMSYFLAGFISWLPSMLVNFLLNRRYTFKFFGRADMLKQWALFLPGSLGQMALAFLGYWILIGLLHFSPAIAYPINLTVTSAMMFTYLKFVTFFDRNVIQ